MSEQWTCLARDCNNARALDLDLLLCESCLSTLTPEAKSQLIHLAEHDRKELVRMVSLWFWPITGDKK